MAERKGLPAGTDIYKYYDLDWIVTVPNMDPHIRPFEVLEEDDEAVVVRTGFEAVIRKKFADPMPDYLAFDTDTLEKAEPSIRRSWDDRRFLSRATTRSPAWATASPATPRHGSRRSIRCIPISRSTAASARRTSNAAHHRAGEPVDLDWPLPGGAGALRRTRLAFALESSRRRSRPRMACWMAS